MFNEELLSLVEDADPPTRWIVLDASAIYNVDFSGGETMRQAVAELHDRGARLVIAELNDDTRRQLDRYGVSDLIGADGYFDSVGEAIDSFRSTVEG
jgi:MFS superfamily sulfate permease-like transporter